MNRARNPLHSPILFAGGCHIEGYPVGEDFSFPRVAMQEHPDYEAHFLRYLNLTSVDRLYKACNSLNPRFLVLQLGHYEAPRELGKVIRPSRLFRSNTGIERPSSKPWVPDAKQHFQPNLPWELKAFTRFSLGYGLRLLKHPLFEKDKARKSLRTLLSYLPRILRDRTFLLSPFPCPDTLMRLYRLELHEVFATAAKQAGCRFVDAQSELMEHEESPRDSHLYADPYHLSVEGHLLVGQLLARTWG